MKHKNTGNGLKVSKDKKHAYVACGKNIVKVRAQGYGR
jgi:hypothetical protein